MVAVQFVEFKGSFYMNSFTEIGSREDKLDTGENRMNQRKRAEVPSDKSTPAILRTIYYTRRRCKTSDWLGSSGARRG